MDSAGRRKRSTQGSNRGMIRIPMELLYEILLWLPAISVIRFRCVCKLWRSITQDPSFINAHLDRARIASPPSILFLHANYNWEIYSISIMDQNSRRAPKRILWGPKPRRQGTFLGNSCNGLICIYTSNYNGDGRFNVINPATAESLTLPNNAETECWGAGTYLGFHHETKEYKVIHFFHNKDEFGRGGCEVHTLHTIKWRPICIRHSGFLPWRLCRGPLVVKGAMYWVGINPYKVVSFDLKGENFTCISFPDSKNYQKEVLVLHKLVELQGSVCLTKSISSRDGTSQLMDLWMLTVNTDGHNNTKYEWALKYSVVLPLREWSNPKPLLIHEEAILVHIRNHRSRSEEMIYCPINNSKRRSRKKVFCRKGKPARPPICYYLEGQYTMDERFFRWDEIPHYEPFVHIESLVQLQSN